MSKSFFQLKYDRLHSFIVEMVLTHLAELTEIIQLADYLRLTLIEKHYVIFKLLLFNLQYFILLDSF